jgi:hypothetical protein
VWCDFFTFFSPQPLFSGCGFLGGVAAMSGSDICPYGKENKERLEITKAISV